MNQKHQVNFTQIMLKKVKNPNRYRLGYEYNEAVDMYNEVHKLFIKQMQKTAELQDEIDQLNNLCTYYKNVDKSKSHFRTGV